MSDETKDTATPVLTPGKINKARRRFLAHTGMYTAGLMGSTLLGACSDNATFALDNDNNTGPSDAQILTFALNLEYLEAEFYLRATTGSGLPSDLIGDRPGMVDNTGDGNPVDFGGDTIARNYANEIAADERDHVRFLRGALDQAGVNPVDRPHIDLNGAFQAAAAAAGLPNADNFDAFASPTNFLLAAFIFEDVGVTAYKGASPFIDNKTYLEAAAGILAAEAYHAGLVRTVLYSRGTDVRGITDAISDARDSVDGDSDLDQGVSNREVILNGQSRTASNIVPLSDSGIAFSRSPGQVLNVVYLTPNQATSGGFFPDGVNGALNQSANNG